MLKTALVTGSTGFIGSNLIRHLLDDGWLLNVIVRPGSNLKDFDTLGQMPNIHIFNGKFDSLRAILRNVKPDMVFHLASLFISEHKPEDITPLIFSNISFPTMLLEAMRLEGVKNIVNTGTGWQHFNGNSYDPVNLYAASKQAFQDILTYYVLAYEFNSLTLKLCDTYGAGDIRPKLVQLLIKSGKLNEEILLSPGDQEIDLVHVDDVSRAFLVAADMLLKNHLGNMSFGVSSSSPISIRNLVKIIEICCKLTIPVVWGGRPYRAREVMKTMRADPILPNWAPLISLTDGLSEFDY